MTTNTTSTALQHMAYAATYSAIQSAPHLGPRIETASDAATFIPSYPNPFANRTDADIFGFLRTTPAIPATNDDAAATTSSPTTRFQTRYTSTHSTKAAEAKTPLEPSQDIFEELDAERDAARLQAIMGGWIADTQRSERIAVMTEAGMQGVWHKKQTRRSTEWKMRGGGFRGRQGRGGRGRDGGWGRGRGGFARV